MVWEEIRLKASKKVVTHGEQNKIIKIILRSKLIVTGLIGKVLLFQSPDVLMFCVACSKVT